MRVMFIHATRNDLTPEYKVHTRLATSAAAVGLEAHFIWQGPIMLEQVQVSAYDFGRDMSLAPKPNRFQRAGMMALKLPRALGFLKANIREIKPDLIYTSQQSFDVFLANWLSRMTQVPHVIHLHYIVGPWLGRHTLNVIKKSSRLIAVSEYVRRTALLQGIPAASVHTVFNPAPVWRLAANQNAQTIRAEFKFELDTPLVIAVGRLDPQKGYLKLFSAFAQVVQKIPNARLLVCGTSTTRDDYAGRLKQNVRELQLSSYVIFAGQREDIPAIMQSGNVFCMAAELEAFGLVFVEAMAAGTPVVACYSGGVPEVVIQNQTGLLSPPGDVPALAANLIRVLSDTVYARGLGEAGQRRAASEFGPEKIAQHWISVLQEMVGPVNKVRL